MNEENKKANIQEELSRADDAKASAELLFKNGYLADAISRLYYSVFHTVKALLFTQGLEPKSHEGAVTLFSAHFVRKGLFFPSDLHVFSKLMSFRQRADYNPSYVFTKDDYVKSKTEGDELCSKIGQYLKEKGFV